MQSLGGSLLAASNQHSDGTAPILPEQEGSAGSILWMDDSEQLCRLTSAMLERQCYNVVIATNGEQAIDRYIEAMSSAKPFDLVVLDLTVQGGLGGFDTLVRLRELDPNVVALACSGYSDEETEARVAQAGFRGLIAKPFLAAELYGAVQAAISKHGYSSEAPPESRSKDCR